MIMKQFNLEEYLANPSKKVVTRDGRSVRIICTDRKTKNDYPIIALIEGFGGDEDFLCYRRDGKWPSCKKVDLFFAPEKHEGWINIYRADDVKCIATDKYVYRSEIDAINGIAGNKDYIATVKIEWEE